MILKIFLKLKLRKIINKKCKIQTNTSAMKIKIQISKVKIMCSKYPENLTFKLCKNDKLKHRKKDNNFSLILKMKQLMMMLITLNYKKMNFIQTNRKWLKFQRKKSKKIKGSCNLFKIIYFLLHKEWAQSKISMIQMYM